uniref:Uncharacterized protein n=1 Tax=Megaselia scalaris TaxID=36166 RepID=T1GKJ0_MEGSC
MHLKGKLEATLDPNRDKEVYKNRKLSYIHKNPVDNLPSDFRKREVENKIQPRAEIIQQSRY